MCTVNDVARLAQVSTATVSRVLTGVGSVAFDTRSKVLDAISQLQYNRCLAAAEMGRRGGSSRVKNKKAGLEIPQTLEPKGTQRKLMLSLLTEIYTMRRELTEFRAEMRRMRNP
jgi:hypothetical protein